MIEYLRMLKDGVRHLSYGDPYEGPTVQASDVVQWAVDEIASLLAAGDRLESQLCEAAKERDSLRLAIRRLAEQDATLSVCDGNVTVTMDATLTDAEWEAIDTAEASLLRESTDLHTPLPVRQRLGSAAATLRGLRERMG